VLGIVLSSSLLACSGTPAGTRPGAGGSAAGGSPRGEGGGGAAAGGRTGNSGSGGSGGTSSGAGGTGPSQRADASGGGSAVDAKPPLVTAACAEHPEARALNGTILELPIVVDLNGKPLVYGDANPIAGGRTITPLNLRFYISAVSLSKGDGSAPVPADLVTAAGAVEPYGIHFYNAEEAASAVLRVRAPAGSYQQIDFVFGLEDRCNAGPPERNPPLSTASQMTWPHDFAYLFLRYEGRIDPAAGAAAPGSPDGGISDPPTSIHMGGFPNVLLAPAMKSAGTIRIPANAPSPRLHFILDEVFKAALTDVPDLRTSLPALLPPGQETLLGEHLRQTAPTRPIFVVRP
jgi:methanobactin biosynthesis MbnP-like protein